LAIEDPVAAPANGVYPLLDVAIAPDVPAMLALLRALASRCENELGAATECCDDVLLVLEELVTNVIRHVLVAGTGSRARLKVLGRDNALAVWLWDDGPAYDPFSTTAEPGYGLRIIRALVHRPVLGLRAGANQLEFCLPLIHCPPIIRGGGVPT